MLKTVIHRELNRYEDWWISPRDLDVLAENIADAISKGPEYSISESRTHWHECWRYTSHHACAVAEVERLQAALEAMEQENQGLSAACKRALLWLTGPPADDLGALIEFQSMQPPTKELQGLCGKEA